MRKPKIYLSIVIPAYKEGERFKPEVFKPLHNYLNKQKFTWEVLLVDDGSPDNTYSILSNYAKKNKGFKALTIEHMGKVGAVSAGVMASQGEIVLFSDFDQSTPISEFAKFDKEFKNGADIVIAQRVRETKNDKLFSKLRSKFFNLLTQLIVLPGIHDTQCGFKAFKNPMAKQLFSSLRICRPQAINGPYMGAFDVELLYMARLRHLRISSVAVKWMREDSKNLKFSEPFKMLRDIVKIRLAHNV